jgi:hypothetical protein
MIASAVKLAVGIVVGAVLMKESKLVASLYDRLREKIAEYCDDGAEGESDIPPAAVPPQ